MGELKPLMTEVVQLPLPQSQERIACLQILSGSMAGQVFPLRDQDLLIGRESGCGLSLDEPGVSRNHARIVADEAGFELIDLESTNGVLLEAEKVSRHRLRPGDILGLGSVWLKFDLHTPAELELAQKIYAGATRDALTGALNRRSFFELFEREVSSARRHRAPLSMAMVDVDHFKSINDRFGHPAGDAVLRQLADRLRGDLRIEDALGRYGGEEFAMLMRHTALEGAVQVAERVRLRVAGKAFALPDRELDVTVSIGVASWNPEDGEEQLLRLADEALYKAKESGRNCVQSAATGREADAG